MKCGYLECSKDAGLSKKNGKERKYCCHQHTTMESNRKRRVATKKRNAGYGGKSGYGLATGINVVEEAHVENIKYMENALKGDKKSQQALKTQGLRYHYNREQGEWGDATKTEESVLSAKL